MNMLFTEFVEINPYVPIERGKEYPCVMMDEVEPGRKFVSGIILKPFKGGSKFKKGDTLFARITPCLENGKIAKYTGQNGKHGFGSTEFFVFRSKNGLSDSDFVYYLALSDIIRKPAEASMFGASGRQRADLSVVQNIEVEVPPLPTQHKIAGILSTYDDLIENNTRRINILEEMAQRIYKEWFVNFRYPGHENDQMVESELGMIPEGWEVKKLKDVVNKIVLGGTPARKNPDFWKNGTIPWIKSGKLNDIRVMEGTEHIALLGLSSSATKLMPPRTVLIAITGAIIISLSEIELCANQSVVGIYNSVQLSQEYIYLYEQTNIEQFISKMSGSAQQHINKEIVQNSSILMPDEEVMVNFNDKVIPIFDLVSNLLKENKNLKQTRDLLLPKLISGKVDVSELDIDMGAET